MNDRSAGSAKLGTLFRYQVSTTRSPQQLAEEIADWASKGWRLVSVTSHHEQLVAILEHEEGTDN